MSAPSLIGGPVNAIPTPALVVDLDRLEQNLRRLAEYFATRPAKLRPHFKSHKCVELARRQLAAGSCTGITCAKLSEAEQLVAGNVSDILIANQVVGPDKARRLAALNRAATVRSAVDSPVNARELSTAATAAGVCIPVLVEVDLGMKRCGVSAGARSLACPGFASMACKATKVTWSPCRTTRSAPAGRGRPSRRWWKRVA
jgi:D-serine deaminase-like pyridoxal phosphate-dependent protein